VATVLLVVLSDVLSRLFELGLENRVLGQPGRRRAKLLEQGMPSPGRLDQEDGLLEVVSDHRAEFELDARPIPRAVADRQPAVASEELDEDVVSHDPLVVLA